MLVLGRKNGERIRIGRDVVVEVIRGSLQGKTKIGVEAPGQTILREELLGGSRKGGAESDRAAGPSGLLAIEGAAAKGVANDSFAARAARSDGPSLAADDSEVPTHPCATPALCQMPGEIALQKESEMLRQTDFGTTAGTRAPVLVRLLPSERALLNRAAQAEGCSANDFIRRRIVAAACDVLGVRYEELEEAAAGGPSRPREDEPRSPAAASGQATFNGAAAGAQDRGAA